MKTHKYIAIYLVLFLLGMVLQGFSQGIVNDAGYITGSSTSYLEFSGSGDMLLIGNTADKTTLGNVKIDMSGSGTYKLIIPDSSKITVDGTLTINDTLLLQANSSREMASLITNGTVSGSKAKVQQYVVSGQYHQISSPVSDDYSDVYLGIWMLEWSEPDSAFTYITATDHPLTTTEGFFIWSNANTTVEFEGTLNTGNYTVPNLSYTTSAGGGNGWNLIGNPYPSALDWTSSWTKSNITATMYVYDGSNYDTYNYNTGGTGGFNGEIMPTQGFWVLANGSSPSLTIPNSERVHSANTFYKDDPVVEDIFSMRIEGNGYSNEMLIGMNKMATSQFDAEWDAWKLFGIEASPQIFTFFGDEEYAVNIVGDINHSKTIPVGIKTGAEGEYILYTERLNEFSNEYDIFLEDLYEMVTIDLRDQESYTFYTTEGMVTDRFILHFGDEMTGEEEVTTPTSAIYSHAKTIYIDYREMVPGIAMVYDVLGNEILTSELNINTMNLLKINHGVGYYIVKVVSENGVSTAKVYIQ